MSWQTSEEKRFEGESKERERERERETAKSISSTTELTCRIYFFAESLTAVMYLTGEMWSKIDLAKC
jgi:hypothetical protein